MYPRTLQLFSLVFLAGMTVSLAQAGDAKDDSKKVATAQIAHIRLHGELDEGPPSQDPLFGTLTENFKQVLERVQKAQRDDKVQALVIHLDGLQVGWAKVAELKRAIENFRKTGKKVYAYVESGEAKDFIVGTAADKVVMPPSGWLMLVGTRAEILFYKDLLEKLGIRADFLQMGVFKFAAEPMTRSKMSKEARAQFETVLGDFFENDYAGSIAKARKTLSLDQVKKLIDEGPYSASEAAKNGLIDEVAYRDQIEKLIETDLKREVTLVKDYGKKKIEDLDFGNPFALFKLFAPTKASVGNKKDRIALIYAVGAIVTGKGGTSMMGGSSVGSTTMIEAIKQADADPKVRAIVLRVDSPGGSALASDLIWHELKKCKKPVIASMSDVAASGGYYISVGAQKIYAEPGTLTGSIGVVGGKLVMKGLFDKVGLNTEIISYGKNSGVLSSSNPFSDSERKAMERLMAEVYDQFLSKTIEGRAKAGKTFTRDQLLKLAEGRIWTGRQAKEFGLVDELGSLDDAIADAKQLGGLTRETDVDFLILPKAHSFLDTFLEQGIGSSALSASELRRVARQADLGDALLGVDSMLQLRSEPVWVMLPFGLKQR